MAMLISGMLSAQVNIKTNLKADGRHTFPAGDSYHMNNHEMGITNRSISCTNWLATPAEQSYIDIGNLSVAGNKITRGCY